jgi:CRISPR-associated protein Cas1
MKRLLNSLLVTTQGAYLGKEGDALVVSVNRKPVSKVPILNLGNVLCFERVTVSPQAMYLCTDNNVSLSFFGFGGRFLARVQGPVSGNVLLRREQYRRADNPDSAATIARSVLIAKLRNSRTVLLRAARDGGERVAGEQLRDAAARLKGSIDRLRREQELDIYRGIEGEAARTYFSVFSCLVTTEDNSFRFDGRSRRPPLDPLNALLSFIYSLLAHECAGALDAVGLDPAVGFLHSDRPGRPGLALDMMEEFRAPIADRLVLSLINRRQVASSGFVVTESGAVEMDESTRKTVINAWRDRKEEEITHPFLQERMHIGWLPHVQALLLSRYLRGDLDVYPPFVWR